MKDWICRPLESASRIASASKTMLKLDSDFYTVQHQIKYQELDALL